MTISNNAETQELQSMKHKNIIATLAAAAAVSSITSKPNYLSGRNYPGSHGIRKYRAKRKAANKIQRRSRRVNQMRAKK